MNTRTIPGTTSSAGTRWAVLVAAFLGWLFGGVQIGITGLAMRPAAIELMNRAGELDLNRYNDLNARLGSDARSLTESEEADLTDWNARAASWFAWHQCAFLFGAAGGGYLFGRLGDRMGRTKALALSIVCFSVFTGLAFFSQTPWQLLALRVLACIGIGGTWPNGVALLSEAWPKVARPMVAGSIGMAGNLGIFLMSSLAARYQLTPESWRWVMVVGALPVLLGVLAWFAIPESPRWLAARRDGNSERGTSRDDSSSLIFRRPFLGVTLLGIALATVPLIGGWGSANWMIPWADEAGAIAENPFLKAHVGQARSITSILGSFMGGWIASRMGRRFCYFLVSLGALAVAQYSFWFTTPSDADFLIWVGALGLFNGIYFGWLPFVLPELFPTRIRSTGAGVSFNFGRILTATTIFLTGTLKDVFHGDYAQIGRVTSWIFALGMVVILFAPDTTKNETD